MIEKYLDKGCSVFNKGTQNTRDWSEKWKGRGHHKGINIKGYREAFKRDYIGQFAWQERERKLYIKETQVMKGYTCNAKNFIVKNGKILKVFEQNFALGN